MDNHIICEYRLNFLSLFKKSILLLFLFLALLHWLGFRALGLIRVVRADVLAFSPNFGRKCSVFHH